MQAERLGEEGQIDESMKAMAAADQLRQQRDLLMRRAETGATGVFIQERQMQVCPVCGAFLQISDVADGRILAHNQGKQHIGYLKIRDTIATVRVCYNLKIVLIRHSNDGRKRDRRGRRSEQSARKKIRLVQQSASKMVSRNMIRAMSVIGRQLIWCENA